MKDKLKKLLNKENIFVLIFVLVSLHPFIELDYLAYGFLDSINLPRLTTIVNFIFYPLLVIAVFFMFDKNKKRTLLFAIPYALVFLVYFILHYKNCLTLLETKHLYLPGNFIFTIKNEIVYVLTLYIPLVYIYVFNMKKINDNIIEKISLAVSATVAWPIFISNIFVFGLSTYEGKTINHFLTWFSLPFNDDTLHPRFYSTKFFFEKGNPIGMVLLFVLPLLYYCLFKEEKKNKKIFLTIDILIHSLSMIILSTRIATFGAVLVPLVMGVYYFVLILLKKEKLQKYFMAFLAFMVVITAIFMPVCPAVQNQMVDARSYEYQRKDNDYLESVKDDVKKETGLEPFSKEWIDFYAYMFEQYSFLIHVTPPVYYTEYYSYRFDPKFWVDVIFDYPLEERVDGRQIEAIFTNYKYDQLDTKEKSLGMGYSTFMMGSILIERDFVQQYYSFGLIGFILLMCPWIVVVLYCAYKLITQYKKWTFLNITLMMIVCIGIFSSLLSGHTLDELSCSMFIALCAGMLIHNLNDKTVEE